MTTDPDEIDKIIRELMLELARAALTPITPENLNHFQRAMSTNIEECIDSEITKAELQEALRDLKN